MDAPVGMDGPGIGFVDMLISRLDRLEARCDRLDRVASTLLQGFTDTKRDQGIGGDAFGMPNARIFLDAPFCAKSERLYLMKIDIEGADSGHALEAFPMLYMPDWMKTKPAMQERFEDFIRRQVPEHLLREMKAFAADVERDDVLQDHPMDEFAKRFPPECCGLSKWHTYLDDALVDAFLMELCQGPLMWLQMHYIFGGFRAIMRMRFLDFEERMLDLCGTLGIRLDQVTEVIVTPIVPGLVPLLKATGGASLDNEACRTDAGYRVHMRQVFDSLDRQQKDSVRRFAIAWKQGDHRDDCLETICGMIR